MLDITEYLPVSSILALVYWPRFCHKNVCIATALECNVYKYY